MPTPCEKRKATAAALHAVADRFCVVAEATHAERQHARNREISTRFGGLRRPVSEGDKRTTDMHVLEKPDCALFLAFAHLLVSAFRSHAIMRSQVG